jgi:gamma-glutamyltranspeptidase/glutathione hydrolase
MTTSRYLLYAVVFAALVGGGFACASVSEAQDLPTDPTDPRLNQGAKATMAGDKVMVATQLPIVSQTAIEVLKDGGNAVDAMITAVFMQHVNDYHQVSHFGAMSAIGYDAASQKLYAINAVSARPKASRGEHGDAAKVAIGGVVRGLEALAKKYGTREWASYLEPAIKSAEEGVLVTSFQYGINYSLWESSDWMKKNKRAREFYMPDGFLVPVGQRWKMPTLAETLCKVASEGADYLYTGEWGRKFVEAANKKGFRVSLEDMAEYEPTWDEPVQFTYRGHTLYGSPPPDTGGVVVGTNLNVLESFDLKSMGHYSESAEALEIMARTFDWVSNSTRGSIKDPLNHHVPVELFFSKAYGKVGAQFVKHTQVLPNVSLKPADETGEASVLGGLSPMIGGSEGDGHPALGSNHNVIVDDKGNWISMLHTGHGGAPGIFIDGVRATGSGARGDTEGPGRRVVLPITAIMIVKDGKPWLAMGTPGSPPQPVTEVLVNILDYGMNPKDAADAPRFWALRGDNRAIRIESRITKEVREKLAARGLKIEELGGYSWHTGSMQIIWRDFETGKLHGATDPRRLGSVAGY